MAALANVVKFSAQLANRRPGILYNVVRNHWNKDFKPGPYPTTEEEKKKAAAKYNLHPDAYEPYPDDGLGYGDYPKLPLVSGDAKDPNYPWDYPAFKRNFNEPVHALEEMINETRYDISKRHRFSMGKMWASCFGVIAFWAGLFIYFDQPHLVMHPPVLAKQYPGQGPHYLFPETGEKSSPHH